jgi:hypothetical protein
MIKFRLAMSVESGTGKMESLILEKNFMQNFVFYFSSFDAFLPLVLDAQQGDERAARTFRRRSMQVMHGVDVNGVGMYVVHVSWACSVSTCQM